MKEQPNQQITPKEMGTKIYKRAEKSIKEPPTTSPLWLLNDTYFCYDRIFPTNNDNEKKTTFRA